MARSAKEQAAYLDGYQHGIRVRRHRCEEECMAMLRSLYEQAGPEVKRELEYPDDPTRRPWSSGGRLS
jgi:hypothetical protein